ncbi:auxilin-related protein 2-like [Iris pallida]|uniref:Auxilin-related protein 2-like n=1 Tax=Iris pallida TaxID=29817 RepID=A0AAX6E3V1_IRIPA|nr:auxilin-related protein 2-like [Iris pallida]
MDDFPGLLARDFGFRPQGKSAPMKPSGPGSAGSAAPPAYARSASASNPQASSFDSIFDGFKDPNPSPSPASASSMPVFDKPVYDDDIFEGIPGMRSSAKFEYDDVFSSMSPPPGMGQADDLLASLREGSSSKEEEKEKEREGGSGGLDDLIPGFGGSSPPKTREPQESNQQKTTAKPAAAVPEDPFVVLETTSTSVHTSSGLFTDPLEQLGKPTYSGSPTNDTSSASGGVFDNIDAFDGLTKSVPSFTSETNENRKEKSPIKTVPSTTNQKSSSESFENVMPKTETVRSFDSRSSFQSPDSVDSPYERNVSEDQSRKSSEHFETADDVWLTVSEIPLFTQPTSAPPPSRPPPKLVIKQASFGRIDPRKKEYESFSSSSPSYHYAKSSVRKPSVSPIDELENFAMGKPQTNVNERADVLSSEEDIETNSSAAASAAAMKQAMDRAEAKFKHAKEVRERERDAKSGRNREFAQRDEQAMPDILDSEDKEKQEKLDREGLQRERDEREEQRRFEKVREQELAREREKARQAVERATKEARERAAAEARLRAERAAVEKANAEARQRAERHAVQRAAAEARERAATEARERAERAAGEARERAAAEAREKAARERTAMEARERAAVDRAAAEARHRAERAAVDRAHAEARERAAAAAREKQYKTENDLDSFFGMGPRANSAPKQRAAAPENFFDNQAQNRGSVDSSRRASSTSSSTIRKASSTTNIVDDLSSIFGATPSPSSGDFQEVEGESEERRRARLERHQRTLERAAKALAEKNERDMQTQRDQAERHRIAETLDIEIKRWAAGKEGNLRALLSTMQYVLWPECGWQPVSLTDLITGAAVKKVYRKATLCIHPDKVQQKGATLQQKYIAEKVFDLLKEAWNKFNSEELF